MKKIQLLKEQRAALLARAEALVALRDEETRDWTPEEDAEYNGIVDDATGSIAKCDRELKSLLRLEELQAQAAIRQSGVIDLASGGDRQRIVIPATCRRVGSLKAFKGPDADVNAYTAGQWLLATIGNSGKSQQWCREHGVEIRGALSGGSNTLGGFLVPTQMETAIIDLREEYGVLRQNAYVLPMASDSATIPRRSSGLTAYFVNENAEITASDVGWDQIGLNARKLATLTKYSSELDEDAVISIADAITTEAAYALAVKEDNCGFVGTGTSTYGGIVGIVTALLAGSEVTAITGNTAFSTLDLADFENMLGKLPAYPGIQPKWYISKAGWAASMMRLLDAAGGNTIAMLQGGVQPSFLGYPVVLTQVMNSTLTAQTSTEGLVIFGDLRLGVVLGDRRGVSMDMSRDRYFEYDQLAVRVTERFDINVHGVGTSSVPGPIVQLNTPGS